MTSFTFLPCSSSNDPSRIMTVSMNQPMKKTPPREQPYYSGAELPNVAAMHTEDTEEGAQHQCHQLATVGSISVGRAASDNDCCPPVASLLRRGPRSCVLLGLILLLRGLLWRGLLRRELLWRGLLWRRLLSRVL